MLSLTIAGVPVLMSKFFKQEDADAMLDAIGNAERVVFIDTAATSPLYNLITVLCHRDVRVIIRDHHDVLFPNNEREEQVKSAAQAIRNLLGDAAIISDRANHPACSTLIEMGEFKGKGTVIVADPDPDGLTATMKAVGNIYPELDADAAILDGARSEQTAENLSPLALLLCKGLSTLPLYNPQRPQISELAKSMLFNEFSSAVAGSPQAHQALENRVNAYEAAVAVAEAERLAELAEVLVPGLVMVDTVGAERYDLTTLTNKLVALEAKVTVIRKDNGPIANPSLGFGGVQISLAVVKSSQDKINLMGLKPDGVESSPTSGIISNIPVLLHCSEAMWTETVRPGLEQLLAD